MGADEGLCVQECGAGSRDQNFGGQALEKVDNFEPVYLGTAKCINIDKKRCF